MIVSLILEEQQPRFFLAVDLNIDHHGARVDLFGLVKLVEFALSLQMLYRYRRDIHQRDSLVPSELSSDIEIVLVGLLEQWVFKGYTVDHSIECSVPAVIRPVCVDHPEFGDSRVPVLCVAEILHAHSQIRLVHRKTHRSDAASHLGFCHVVESLEHLHLCRDLVMHLESLRHVKRSASRLYRVDHIIHYCVDICRHEFAIEHIYSGKSYRRSLSAAKYLYALLG